MWVGKLTETIQKNTRIQDSFFQAAKIGILLKYQAVYQ